MERIFKVEDENGKIISWREIHDGGHSIYDYRVLSKNFSGLVNTNWDREVAFVFIKNWENTYEIAKGYTFSSEKPIKRFFELVTKKEVRFLPWHFKETIEHVYVDEELNWEYKDLLLLEYVKKYPNYKNECKILYELLYIKNSKLMDIIKKLKEESQENNSLKSLKTALKENRENFMNEYLPKEKKTIMEVLENLKFVKSLSFSKKEDLENAVDSCFKNWGYNGEGSTGKLVKTSGELFHPAVDYVYWLDYLSSVPKLYELQYGVKFSKKNDKYMLDKVYNPFTPLAY